MGEKDYRLKNINELEKMKKQKENQQKTDLLDLFTTYIYMTNPDYQYNETYLKDMIPDFWNNVSIYTKKLEIREKISKSVQPITIMNDIKLKIQIQFDETWELNYTYDTKESKGDWEMRIADIPNLTAVDYNKTYVKCNFSDNQYIYFSDYIVADNEDDIIDFVMKSINLVKKRMVVE